MFLVVLILLSCGISNTSIILFFDVPSLSRNPFGLPFNPIFDKLICADLLGSQCSFNALSIFGFGSNRTHERFYYILLYVVDKYVIENEFKRQQQKQKQTKNI